MAKYLITNENGDWWEFDPTLGVGNTLWVIETSKLEHILIDQDDRLNSTNDIYALDKLEDDIREHGEVYNLDDMM